MIVTTVQKTDEVMNQYSKLFQEANTLLGSEQIKTLSDYYNALKDIVETAKNQGKSWQYFTMLPLDEDLFIIDANTRKISVPNSFKVIGLEGEAYAETIYFKINRYFDITDFGSSELTCVIEWKIGDVIGASKPYTIKQIGDEQALLLGWTLSQDILQSSGILEFAIRFYKLEANDEYSFNFSTLPASVSIGKTLNIFDPADEVEDASEIIYNRIVGK